MRNQITRGKVREAGVGLGGHISHIDQYRPQHIPHFPVMFGSVADMWWDVEHHVDIIREIFPLSHAFKIDWFENTAAFI